MNVTEQRGARPGKRRVGWRRQAESADVPLTHPESDPEGGDSPGSSPPALPHAQKRTSPDPEHSDY